MHVNRKKAKSYESLAFEGATLNNLANQFNDEQIPPPKRSYEWEATLISKMVKNPVYKGEFVAHRWYSIKVRRRFSDKLVSKKVERPQDEWIIVPVPPIISPEVWELANEALKKNLQVSKRNLQYDALLARYLKCATCGSSFIFHGKTHRKRDKTYFAPSYRCVLRHVRTKKSRARFGCDQSQISAKILDQAVWKVVSKILLEPTRIIEAIDLFYSEQGMKKFHDHIQYISHKIACCDREDDKLYKAYLADVFDEDEFAEKRQDIKSKKASLIVEKEALQNQMIDESALAAMKQQVLDLSKQVCDGQLEIDIPFEEKRWLLKQLVDHIVVDVNNRQFTMYGAVKGMYTFEGEHFTSTLADRGSLRQLG